MPESLIVSGDCPPQSEQPPSRSGLPCTTTAELTQFRDGSLTITYRSAPVSLIDRLNTLGRDLGFSVVSA
jgi:hypothetical protein